MIKKKNIFRLTFVLGIILIAISIIFDHPNYITVLSLCTGVGAGLIGLSMANIYVMRYEKKHPEEMNKNEVEYKDERNTLIRYKAKARTCDIMQYFTMALAFLAILINLSIWYVLGLVVIFLFYNVITLTFMSKYQKEM